MPKYPFKPLLTIVLLCGLMASISAQSSPQLCQGEYFTEAQGREFLEKQTPKSPAEWQLRAQQIRNNIIEGAELKKLPPRPKSKPIVHSRREMNGYSVENVAFESLPGYYVTGNLYRPLGQKGPFAAILCPHGHWRNPDGRVKEQMQQRCAQLARMGAVVFAFDMLGYGDNQQCAHDSLPKIFKLQSINSVRALDFLLAQAGIDKNRVAVTGASGGGTQSFMLAALDPRVKVCVPVVMVSAHFFGGCKCESGMPVHKKGDFQTNNVEIAALCAPRPMLIVSDGEDWTKNNPEVEFPFLQNIYQLYGQKDLVENVHFADEGHDYGPSKRAAAYVFLAKHLKLDLSKVQKADGSIDESSTTVLSANELSVFNDKFPWPKNALRGGAALGKVLK
jgi:pimeloyl-ACP methyl ester carboxylesterase